MILRQAVFLVLTALLSFQANAQTNQINTSSAAQPSVAVELTPAQKSLVEGSRKAIIQTGISDAYFTKHFKLFRVVDNESDRRVTWEFKVNEHQTMVTDAIGYRSEGNQRIAIHSVANSLGKTLEVHRTLSRAAAHKRLRSCIGAFENPSVQYGAVNGVAELVLSAEAKRRLPKKESGSEREREAAKEDEQKKMAATSGDLIKPKRKPNDQPPPVILGSVNLITGKCIKGVGRVGSGPLSPVQ